MALVPVEGEIAALEQRTQPRDAEQLLQALIQIAEIPNEVRDPSRNVFAVHQSEK